MSEPEHRTRGSTSSTISAGAVRLLHEYTGRGPTKARTTISDDCVVILFGNSLTKAERTLVDKGDGAVVLQMRHRFQEAMREDLVDLVEAQTEREVVAFMSSNHIDPDLAAEVFVLEPVVKSELPS